MIPLKEDWGGGGGGNPCFYSQDSASITKPWRAPKLINQGCLSCFCCMSMVGWLWLCPILSLLWDQADAVGCFLLGGGVGSPVNHPFALETSAWKSCKAPML